jgi:preprotein translocase subunit SecA
VSSTRPIVPSAPPHPSAHPRRTPLRRFASWFRKTTGDPVDTDLAVYEPIVHGVRGRNLATLSDARLAQESAGLKALIRRLPTRAPGTEERVRPFPVDAEIEAFALVREAARRAIGLDAFDVQLIAGLAMARGRIAELPTGEGKTLAAVFPAYLHALVGQGVHVLTFNDYLARRDAAWMGPAFRLLGLTVGCVQEGMTAGEKRAAYACDVCYATAKEAGFDFLRDGLAYSRDDLVHRPFHCALVDEADSILVDEARIPLVISGLEEREAWDVRDLAGLVSGFTLGRDFATDDEHRNVFLLDAGIERAESVLRRGGLFEPGNADLVEALHCALRAHALLRRDIDYLVRDGRIEIIDEFTGRVVDRRHWPDGLQAAVEAKEGLVRRSQGRILGSITLQHFFGLYPVLAGMTATARSAAHELREFYRLRTVIVPPHVPSRRIDRTDAVFTCRAPKRRALAREIREVHATARPILVGTASVRESEELAADLAAEGIACAVLNAKNDEREAAIIAEAGLPGAVTISTNMAGRGTDIRLGGADERERDRALALGGLYVIGTNRHESLRIDRQLRGRAGRQGDPGSTRFFISLEDDLFERYGLTRAFRRRHHIAPQEEALERGPLLGEIEHAQRVIEGQTFDIRRTIAKYSDLVGLQRRIVAARRDAILRGEPLSDDGGGGGVLAGLDPELHAAGAARFGASRLAEVERRVALHHLDRQWCDHLAWIQDTRETIHLVGLGGMTPVDEFRKQATAAFLDLERRTDDAIVEELRALIAKEGPIDQDLERLKGPSSTWTYLVSDEQFGWGMGLMQTRNLGLAAAAAGFVGPLLIFKLLVDRLRSRRAPAQGEREADASRTPVAPQGSQTRGAGPCE